MDSSSQPTPQPSKLRSKLYQPSSYSPNTTAQTQRRFGGLFASFGLGASGSGSPLRPLPLPSSSSLASPSAKSSLSSTPTRGGSTPKQGQNRSQLSRQAQGTGWDDDSEDEGEGEAGEDGDSSMAEDVSPPGAFITRTSTRYGPGSSSNASTSTPKKDGSTPRVKGGIMSFAERMAQLTFLSTPTKDRKTEWVEEGAHGWGSGDQAEAEAEDGHEEYGVAESPTLEDGLMRLPDELLLAIALHLTPTVSQIHALSMVNRRMYDISRTPILWLRAFEDKGFTLNQEGKEGVAVEYPPLCMCDELDWIAEDGDEDVSDEIEAWSEGKDLDSDLYRTAGAHSSQVGRVESAPDDDDDDDVPFENAINATRAGPRPIHYPTLVRSRDALSQRLRSPSYKPRQTSSVGHDDTVYCLKSVLGKYLITGSRDRSIRIWGLRNNPNLTGTSVDASRESGSDADSSSSKSGTSEMEAERLEDAPLFVVRDAHEGSVLKVDIDVDGAGVGLMVSASSDSTVGVWVVDLSLLGIRSSKLTAGSASEITTDANTEAGVNSSVGISRSPTSSAEGKRETQPNPLERLKTLRGPTASVLDVLLTKKYIVSASKDTLIRLYDRTSFELVRVLEGHEGSVNALALARPPVSSSGVPTLSPDDRVASRAQIRIASASSDGRWIIWDLETGDQVRQGGEGGEGKGLACIVWKGNRIIAGGNDKMITTYDSTTSDLVRSFEGHTDLVRSVAVHEREGLMISASYDRTLRMWDLRSGQCIRTLNKDRESIVFDLELSVTGIMAARHDASVQMISFGDGLPYSDLFE